MNDEPDPREHLYKQIAKHPGSWFCEFCESLEHSTREPYMSMYYREVYRDEVVGPKFCSHNCRYNWKNNNK